MVLQTFLLLLVFLTDLIGQRYARRYIYFKEFSRKIKNHKEDKIKCVNSPHDQVQTNCNAYPNITDAFLSFPWEKYDYSLFNAPNAIVNQFIYNMSLFIELEPKVPINETCSPPILTPIEDIKCENYQNAMLGKRRQHTVKAAHMIDFGFDVDVLEIHLNELYPVVDKIFILEQRVAHYRSTPKPLMWERIRYQPRFRKFEDKVVHLIMDDKEMVKSSESGIWRNENLQERKRWDYFLEWNSKTNYFSDEDIIGFGDTDEIASMQSINILKNCEFSGPIDIGIWFTHGTIHKKFRSDFPVRGHPYTYGDPTYFTIRDAKEFKPYPTRKRGRSGKYLLGGIHLSRYAYLPFLLLKTICQTESENREIQQFIRETIAMLKRGDGPNKVQYYQKKRTLNFFKNRLADIKYEDFGKEEYMLPWFLECNLNRYPSFLNAEIPDQRLI